MKEKVSQETFVLFLNSVGSKSSRQDAARPQRENAYAFSQSCIQVAHGLRWPRCHEPLWGCPHSHYLESVISRLRNRTANEPADTQNQSGELPEWLLA